MKTIVITVLLVALLGAGTGILFVYSGVYNVSAQSPHSAVSNWVLGATKDASVSRRARSVEVPDLTSDALRLVGVNGFEAMCVGCHGAPGKKPGPLGQGLNPSPPDLQHSAREHSPAELFWVTKNGIKMTGMPAWGPTHDDEELWPLVALMSALPELDAKAYDDLVARAEGMGHHAPVDNAEHAHEPEVQTDATPPAQEPNTSAHDHSTHEH
ncbi:MAG: cytochrome c [Gammaproteobacteria bacterium]|nr:cytochrome c [Gammaproteobacteria bacterium]